MLPEVLLFYCRGPAQKPEEEEHMEGLLAGIQAITWQMPVMWVIGGILIYLAIKKDMEPTLLLPMGFGAILVNLPLSSATEVLETLFSAGIANELFPLLLFIGIGAMIDFGPLLSNPQMCIRDSGWAANTAFPSCSWWTRRARCPRKPPGRAPL